MTVELLQVLSLAAYIAAGVLFLVAVALFFLLDVPEIYGDISGRTARKAIESIRKQNEATGNKAYKPSAVNVERGKLTDKITQSGRLMPQGSGSSVGVGTEKLDAASLMPQSNDTTLLENPSNETTVLMNNVHSKGNETTLLVNETYSSAEASASSEFTVDVDMSFTGSSEIIQ